MPNLHETRYGQDLFGHQIPQISRSLAAIAKQSKRANELKERELQLKEAELAVNGIRVKPIENTDKKDT